jgi:hypothetical protein
VNVHVYGFEFGFWSRFGGHRIFVLGRGLRDSKTLGQGNWCFSGLTVERQK